MGKRKITPSEVKELIQQGFTPIEISRRLNVHLNTVYYNLPDDAAFTYDDIDATIKATKSRIERELKLIAVFKSNKMRTLHDLLWGLKKLIKYKRVHETT